MLYRTGKKSKGRWRQCTLIQKWIISSSHKNTNGFLFISKYFLPLKIEWENGTWRNTCANTRPYWNTALLWLEQNRFDRRFKKQRRSFRIAQFSGFYRLFCLTPEIIKLFHFRFFLFFFKNIILPKLLGCCHSDVTRHHFRYFHHPFHHCSSKNHGNSRIRGSDRSFSFLFVFLVLGR